MGLTRSGRRAHGCKVMYLFERKRHYSFNTEATMEAGKRGIGRDNKEDIQRAGNSALSGATGAAPEVRPSTSSSPLCTL